MPDPETDEGIVLVMLSPMYAWGAIEAPKEGLTIQLLSPMDKWTQEEDTADEGGKTNG